MRKTKKGSAAPKKQQTLEDQYECDTVGSMPQNVKTRSKGAVTCDDDLVKVVETMMEGEVLDTPKWCKNRGDTLSGCALPVDSSIFLRKENLEMLEQTWNNYQVYLNDEINFIDKAPVLDYSLMRRTDS